MRQLLLIIYGCVLLLVRISPSQAQDVVEASLRGTDTVEVEIDKGQTVSLGCSMIFTDQVFPPLSYVWRIDGTFDTLSSDPTYVVTPDSDVSYQCVASATNLKDRTVRARGTIMITVRDPPVIATPDQPTVTNGGIEYMIGFNDTCINNTFRGMVNFTCVLVSGRRPLTIGWQVGGEDFTSDGHSMVVTINDTISKLIIGTDTSASLDLDLNDYRCTATNSDGTDTAVSILTRCETVPVIDKGITVDECPPSEGNIGGNFSDFTGGQVVINCTLIDGFPLPNVSWFYMDTELIMFRNSSQIVITVDDDTIGEYTCVATNMLGSDSATSFVDIKFSPVINTSLEFMNNISIDLYEINVGASPIVEVPYNITNVILYCVVSGRGIPSVNWTTPPLDDNYNITTSVEMDGLLYVVTNVFNISNFTNDYAGVYQCNATNCGGQDSSGINTTQQVVYFVGFSRRAFSGSEGSTSSISLVVSRPAPFDITLNLLVTEMTATLDTDFYFIDGSTDLSIPVTIPMGSITYDISFTVRNDTIIETDETFGLGITVTDESSSLDVLLSGNIEAIVTLQDNDNFGITVRFTQSSYSAMERTGFVDVELELVGGTSADPFNVFVTPSEQSPASAEGGSVDFDSNQLTARFAGDSSMSTVRVPVTVDNIVEMTEEFILTLTVPMLRGITPGSITMATGMIVDTTVVQVQFSQNSFTGTEADGFILVNVLLVGGSSDSSFGVTVTPSQQTPVSAQGGGVDFNSDMLTASFASMTIMSNVSVPVSSDMILEGNEEFNLALTIPSSVGRGIELGSISTAVGVIVDSTMLVVEFTSGQFTGSESSGSVEVIVRITGGTSTIPITVTVTPSVQSPVSAMGSGVDFNSNPFTITINAGATEGRGNITVTCDDEVEGSETFDMTLTLTSSPTGVMLGRDTSEGVITDSTVEVSFSQSSYDVMEDDGRVTLMIRLSQPSSVPFQVTINTMDGTAVDSGDYTGGTRVIDVPAGVMTQPFTVDIVDNDIVECDETFIVTITSVTTCGVTIGNNNRSEVTITDDDSAVVSLSQSQYSVAENDTSLTGSITLSSTTSEDVMVEVTLSDGSAIAGEDYAMSTAMVFTVTISAGSRSSSFDVDIFNDMIQEINETFNIAIRLLPSCLSLSLGTSSSTVTITDNDVARITFQSSTFSGTETSEVISATVEIAGGIVSSRDISVPIMFTQGTATGGGVDFNSATQTATITAGTSNSTVDITVINDNIVEGNEMFTMTLNVPASPGITAGDITMASATIIDTSMIRVRFNQRQFTGSESTGFVMVDLELLGGTSSSDFDVTVTPSEQSPVSATGGVDFVTTTLTATFAAGMTMSSVRVQVINDSIAEGSEQFNLALNVPSSLGPAITAANRDTAVGIIDDSTMLTVDFASGQFTGSESSGTIEVVVRITGGTSSDPVTVTVTPSVQSPVSAMGSGVDFDSNPFNITIDAGSSMGRGMVSIVYDNVVEETEAFNLGLTLVTVSPEIALGRSTSVAQITDSTAVVNFDQSSYNVMEDGGAVTISLTLSRTTTGQIQVVINTMDVTATDPNDYAGGMRTITISAGEMTESFTITIVDDGVVECTESFVVRMVSVTGSGATMGSVNSTEVVIMDDDGAVVSLSQSQYSVTESDTSLTGSITLDSTTSEDVMVEVTLSDGSAIAGEDYAMSTAMVFPVTISAGSRSSPFDVDIFNDMIQEINETFNIAIRLLPSCLSLSLGTSSSTVTITDNDVARITFQSSTFSGTETSEVISATVEIAGGIVSSRDISVPIMFTQGTATGGGVDFNSATQTVTITAGTSNSTVDITVINDDIVEGNEMFTMTLNVPTSPGITAGDITMASATITDTSMIRVRFEQTQFIGSESTGFVMVDLELLRGRSSSDFDVTVTPSEQSPVSARGGVDFVTTALTATFAAGMTMSSVRVQVINDSIAEGSEQFNLALNVPSSLGPAITAGGRNTAVGIISDSTMLEVEFTSGRFTGSESSGFIEVIVRITGGTSSDSITVTVTPSVQSPVSASVMDFNSNPFNITINAGDDEGRGNIAVTCDDEVEGSETFDMTLILTSSPTGVMLGRDTSEGVITDSTVEVSFSQPSYGVMEDDGRVTLMIRLSQPSSVPFQVTINTMDGTAVDGADYTGGMRVVDVPAGVMTQPFTVDIVDNNIVECDETFIVTITSVTTCGVTIGNNNRSEVTITDDDSAVVSLSQSQYSVAESDTSLTGSITLSSTTSEDVMVEVTLSEGSATAGEDYAMSTAMMFTVTISAGSRSSPFDVDIINDMIQEINETFNIAIRLLPSCLSLSLGTSSSTVTITDNDVARITFQSSTFSGTETSEVILATVEIAGGIVSSRDISVPIMFTQGTATGGGVDFNSATQTVTITAGTSNSTVDITVINDDIVEGNEMFTMTLNVPTSPGITAGDITMASATITDTSMIRVRFDQTQFIGSESTGFVMVDLELLGGTSASAFDVTVTPSEQLPVSATGGVDFVTTTLTATFAAGMTMSSVRVQVISDSIAEGSEQFNLALNVPSSLGPAITAGGRNTAVGIITDSTVLEVGFTSGQFTGSESSGFIEVIVGLAGGTSSAPITVTVTPSVQSPVSAMGSGVDFDSNPFTITINAEATEGRANISVTCDDEVEGSETFDMTLTLTSSPTGVMLGRDTSEGVITDSTVEVSFSQSSYGVMEDDGRVTLMIRLSQVSSVPFQVTINTMDGTAVDGADYTGGTRVINVPAGVMTQTFTVDITDNDIVECDETFIVTITSVTTCGVTIGNNNRSEVTITDDDSAVVSLSQSQYSVAESDTSLTGSITLSSTTSEDVMVEVTLSDGSATAGEDYAMSTAMVFTVTISAGSRSSSFDVDIINDMIQEDNETFNIAIRLLPSCLSLSLGTSSSIVTITDDEVITACFDPLNYTTPEQGGPLTIAMMLSNPSSSQISFQTIANDGSALGSSDYTPGPFDVTFPAGMTTASFSVPIADDNLFEGSEVFTVTIVSSTLPSQVVEGADCVAVVTIVDDDTCAVSFSQSTFSVNEDSGPARIDVVACNTLPADFDIVINTRNGSAGGGGQDYDSGPHTATITTGSDRTSLSIPVNDDDIVEGNEDFVVFIEMSSLPNGFVLGAVSQATVTVRDEDRIRVRFAQTQFIGSEAMEFVMVDLELVGGTSASAFDVTVTPSEQLPVSARGGVDFVTTTLTATFAAGMTMSSVRVQVINDSIAEGSEQFNLALNVPSSLGPAITAGGRDTAIGIITDSTMLTVEFTSGQFTGSESSGSVEVIVRITGGTSSDPITVTVTPSVQSPVSAMGSGVDFNSNPFTITINAGATEGRGNIAVTCDDEVEGSETFDMTLTLTSSPTGVMLGRDTSEGVITDSTVEVSFSQSSYGVMEDDGRVTLMIRLSQPSSVPFQVIVNTMDGTAVAGDDYNGNPITVNVSAGVMMQPFMIDIVDSNIVECIERFSVAMVSVTTCGVTIADNNNSSEVVITDDDSAVVSLSESQYSVSESDVSLRVIVMLRNRASEDVMVEVTLSDGSATAGEDYAMSTAMMFTVTISAGSRSSSFDVDIFNDMIQENNEMFNIAIRLLSSCLSLSLGTSSSTVTITDNDVARITFQSSTFSGTETSEVISATVEIAGGIVSSRDIDVPIMFTQGTATGGGVDFNSTTQTATITAGTSNSTVDITVINDDIVEGDEMFTMTLNVPTSPGITAGDITMATGIIIDTSSLTVTFTQRQFTGSEAERFVQVNIELDGGRSADPFNVIVTPSEQSPESATGGVDFATTALTATFAAGMTMSSVRVTVFVDAVAEAPEEFNLALTVSPSLSPAITVGNIGAAVGIITDTTRLVVEFRARQFSGSESSGFIEVIVRLAGGTSTTPVTVTVTPSVQSPVSAMGSDVDFNSDPFNITINAGDTESTANITVTCDDEVEGSETFDMTLTLISSANGVMLGRDTSEGVITDSTVEVSFSQSSYDVMEDDGRVTLMIRLSQQSSVPFQVTVNTMDGTAVDGADYTGGMRVIDVPAGEMTQPFTVDIVDNDIVECDETFIVTITSVTTCGVTIGNNNRSEVTITDDDSAVVSLSQSQYSVAESDTSLTGSITLSSTTSEDVMVEVTLSDGSATAGEDYAMSTAMVFTVTISAGSRSSSFNVDIFNDMIQEINETFNIAIRLLPSCLSLSLGTSSSTVTITDNDVARITFQSSTFSGTETSEVISATVEIAGGIVSSRDIDVPISFTPGTALGGNVDFNSATQTATIAAGTSNSTISIRVINDDIVEGDEMFTMTLNVPTSPGITAGDITMATGIIIDTTNIMVRFRQSRQRVSEAAGSVSVDLELIRGRSANEFSISVIPTEQSPVSAESGADFSASTLIATFASRSVFARITVPIMTDNIAEGEEEFNLVISVPSLPRGVTVGTPSTAVIVIEDSTRISVRFTQSEYTGTEFSRQIVVGLELDGGTFVSPSTLNVTVTATPRSALGGGVDFVSDTLTAVFDAESTSSSVSFPVLLDDLVESNETFDLQLFVPQTQSIRTGSPSIARAIIIDSTVQVTLDQSIYRVAEDDGTVVVMVILSQPSTENIMVTINSSDITANVGEDYGQSGVTSYPVTFTAGSTMQSVTIAIIDDNVREGNQTFRVTIDPISMLGVVTGTPSTAVVTIIETDVIVVRFSSRQYEATEISGAMEVGINLARGTSNVPVNVIVRLASATATAGDDFNATTLSASIPAGQTSTTVTVPIFQDNLEEMNETFSLVLDLAAAIPLVTVGTLNMAFGNIIDSTVQVSFQQNSYNVMEGNSISVSVVLNMASPQQYRITIVSRDDSATAGSDYGTSADVQMYSVTFPAGSVLQSFSVNTLSDDIYEFDETFRLTIQQPSMLGITRSNPTQTEVTIIDTTVLQVEFSAPTFTGSEMSRSVPVSLSIPSGSVARPFSVSVLPSVLSPPSATIADFDTSTINAVFNAGSTTSSVNVPVTTDNILEGQEMFNLTVMSNVARIRAGPRATATGVIDDSTVLMVQFSDRTYSGTEASGFVNVDVALIGGTSATPFGVTVTPSEQSPVSATGGVDFVTTTLTATFAAGMTMSSVRVQLIADSEVEPDERFNLMLTIPSSLMGITEGSIVAATGTIIDSTVTVQFEQSMYLTRENSGMRTIELSLSSALTEPVSVVISAQNITAFAGMDYDVPGTDSQFTVEVPTSTTSHLFSVNIIDDTLFENNEMFSLTIIRTNSTVVTTGGRSTTTITIIDNDELVVGFSAPSFAGTEISGGVQVDLDIMGGVPSQLLRVSVIPSQSSPVSAEAGIDFNSDVQSATFPAGSTTTSVTIPVSLDNFLEGNETFALSLSERVPRVSLSSSRNTATGIIIDSTTSVMFEQATYSINENSVNPLQPVLLLSQPFPNAVTVMVTAQNGTAEAPGDYGPEVSYTVRFPAGSVRQSFDVNIVSDSVLEPDETFSLNIATVMMQNGVVIGEPASTEVTIVETTALTVQFESATYTASENQVIAASLVLSGGTASSPIMVAVTPSEQSPVSAEGGGVDFSSRQVMVSFPPGSNRVTAFISLTCDREVEGNEEFDLALSIVTSNAGVTVGSPSRATAIITDSTVQVGFVSDSVRVNEDVGTASIPIMVSPPSTRQLTIRAMSSVGSSATGGEDYGQAGDADPQTFTTTIPSRSGQGNLRVAIIDDEMFESEEQFTLTIMQLSQCNVVLTGQTSTNVTIVDNDLITVQFSAAQYVATESSMMMIVGVAITGGSSSSVVMATVQPSQQSPVSATGGGVDFGSSSVVATFQPNEDSTTVMIPIVCDTIVEGNEQFNLSLIASPPVILGAQSTATGIIEDSTVTVSFGMPRYSFAENVGSGAIDITLSQAHNAPISVDVRSQDMTAFAGLDYGTRGVSSLQMRVVVPTGSTATQFSVNIINDDILEQTETFRLNMIQLLAGGFCGATIGRTNTEVDITDNDAVTIQFQEPQFSGTEQSESLAATVVLSGGTVSFPFAVTVTPSSGTATAGRDFDAMAITVVFSPGDRSQVVQIPLVCDTVPEGTESFSMSLSTNATSSRLQIGTPRTAIGIIEDSTVTISFSSSSYNVNEATRSVQLTLVFSQPTIQRFTVMVSTMDGTATASEDYSSTTRQLFIPLSSRSFQFSISIINDEILEEDEQFSVLLQLPTDGLPCGITPGSIATATVNIIDNDVLMVRFSSTQYIGSEGNGFLPVKLEISGGMSSTPFNVTVNPSELFPPSALGNGVDFDSDPITATFSPSTRETTVQIPLTQDAIIENQETFNMNLMLDTTNPSIVLGSITMARGVIDDSTVFVQFAQNQYSVREDGRSVQIGLELNRAPGVVVNAMVTTMDITATNGSDYEGGEFSIRFSATQQMQTFTMRIIDDNIVENNELFQLRLTAEGLLAVGDINMATVNITDDENVIVEFTSDSFTATEASGMMTVGLMLTGGEFDRDVTISVTTMQLSATAGRDYDPDPVSAVFPAGQRSTTVEIPIIMDNAAEDDEQFGLMIVIPSEIESLVRPGSDAVGIIKDSSVFVEFEFPTYQINEDMTPVQPRIVISRPLTVDVMIQVDTENLSALAGIDFNIPKVQGSQILDIVIPANTTSVPIEIEIVDDNVLERSETFRLNVMIPQESAALGISEGANPSTRITINNDDSPCQDVTPCSGRVIIPIRSTNNCSVCAVWQAGPYGNCTPDCHLGNQTRNVDCLDRDNPLLVLSNVHCNATMQPISVRRCGSGPCMIRARWRYDQWSACSRTCEGGDQTRRVYCYSPLESKVLPDNDCDATSRPPSYRLCNQHIRCECVDLYPTICPRIMGTSQCMIPEYHQACCMSCAGAD